MKKILQTPFVQMRTLLGYSCSESARIQSPRWLLAFSCGNAFLQQAPGKGAPPLQEVLAGEMLAQDEP